MPAPSSRNPLQTLMPGMAAAATVTALMAGAGSWLQAAAWPALGLAPSARPVATALMTLALFALLAAGLRRVLAGRGPWWRRAQPMPATQAVLELRDAASYLEVMRRQLDGALAESERGAATLIERLNDIHATSNRQALHIDVDGDDRAVSAALFEPRAQAHAHGFHGHVFKDRAVHQQITVVQHRGEQANR